MGKKSTPAQPAPVVVNPTNSATQQASFNKEAGIQQRALNMIDQYTPDGSVTYEETGKEIEGIPQYKVTQSYSPDQQKLYDLGNEASIKYGEIGNTQLDKVRESFESPFTLDSLGASPQVNEETRKATIDAILARNQPQLDRDRDALKTQLLNAGHQLGSQGYNGAMDEANRARNDLYLGADIQAGNEMARMYGLEASERDRAINEMLMERNQPLSEMSSFMSGSQPAMPNFVSTPQGQIAAPDFMGAQYASADAQNAMNMNTYNQQNASAMANRQGLYSLAGTGLKAGGYMWGGR